MEVFSSNKLWKELPSTNLSSFAVKLLELSIKNQLLRLCSCIYLYVNIYPVRTRTFFFKKHTYLSYDFHGVSVLAFLLHSFLLSVFMQTTNYINLFYSSNVFFLELVFKSTWCQWRSRWIKKILCMFNVYGVTVLPVFVYYEIMKEFSRKN